MNDLDIFYTRRCALALGSAGSGMRGRAWIKVRAAEFLVDSVEDSCGKDGGECRFIHTDG